MYCVVLWGNFVDQVRKELVFPSLVESSRMKVVLQASNDERNLDIRYIPHSFCS